MQGGEQGARFYAPARNHRPAQQHRFPTEWIPIFTILLAHLFYFYCQLGVNYVDLVRVIPSY